MSRDDREIRKTSHLEVFLHFILIQVIKNHRYPLPPSNFIMNGTF
jgi:hypothetical protein